MTLIVRTSFDDTNFQTVRSPGIHWEENVDGIDENVVGQTGDGWEGSAGWTTALGAGDQILTAANNSSGGGGKGFRHWVGDGHNVNGGSLMFRHSGQTELYYRFYIRHQLGMAWSGSPNNKSMKCLYINTNNPDNIAGTCYFGYVFDSMGGHVEEDTTGNPSGNHIADTLNSSPPKLINQKTWASWQGGATADGLWHWLELHVKMNTVGVADGIYEFWVDGLHCYRATDVTFNSGVGAASFQRVIFGENAGDLVANGGVDVTVDYDDIEINTVGPIGALGAGGGGSARNPRFNESMNSF